VVVEFVFGVADFVFRVGAVDLALEGQGGWSAAERAMADNDAGWGVEAVGVDRIPVQELRLRDGGRFRHFDPDVLGCYVAIDAGRLPGAVEFAVELGLALQPGREGDGEAAAPARLPALRPRVFRTVSNSVRSEETKSRPSPRSGRWGRRRVGPCPSWSCGGFQVHGVDFDGAQFGVIGGVDRALNGSFAGDGRGGGARASWPPIWRSSARPVQLAWAGR